MKSTFSLNKVQLLGNIGSEIEAKEYDEFVKYHLGKFADDFIMIGLS